ncbi:PadR family transcriptional regulator [Frigoribacterium sp. VKM Ac-2836]|uniref:PadR family transcriptional regulator n=1 Tax=Frigoribacterium sp. VKM Ac-2836 TaxID=2739014 RepID=UPI001567A461|nr:PadR family transcriptional regulator [Frigoribacterium sp. VKM Ac-2836]NRD27965.1 PadR family transcriptional regulator [Frigoribacterium sp. VKM Ac-2836]
MTTPTTAQLRKGVVEYCVLGVLQKGPTYGWLLSEQLVARGLIGSIGTLYPLLSRLRERGLIAAGEGPGPDSTRPRKYFSLTDAGGEELRLFREQWDPFVAAVTELTARADPESALFDQEGPTHDRL